MNTFLMIVKDTIGFTVFQIGKKDACLQFRNVYIASLAEIKIVFFELILIIILATLFTKFTWRKLFIIVGGVVFICIESCSTGTFSRMGTTFFCRRYILL